MGLIKWIIEEVKHDLEIVKAMYQGNAKLKVPLKDTFKDFGKTAKESWMLWLLCITFFCVGYWVASQRYEALCNTLIQNITNPQMVFPAIDLNTSISIINH